MTSHEFAQALLRGPDVPILCPAVMSFRDDGALFFATYHYTDVLRNPDIPGIVQPQATVCIVSYVVPPSLQEGTR